MAFAFLYQWDFNEARYDLARKLRCCLRAYSCRGSISILVACASPPQSAGQSECVAGELGRSPGSRVGRSLHAIGIEVVFEEDALVAVVGAGGADGRIDFRRRQARYRLVLYPGRSGRFATKMTHDSWMGATLVRPPTVIPSYM